MRWPTRVGLSESTSRGTYEYLTVILISSYLRKYTQHKLKGYVH